ncbi:MAG: hypothetical protein K6F22_09065 [Prevotella sp.]|nr:hypothetical protein [Prevotella sp.]
MKQDCIPCDKSYFNPHTSAFIPQPSSFSLHPSAFIPQPSSFRLQPSAFIPQPSALSLHTSWHNLTLFLSPPGRLFLHSDGRVSV